MVRGTRSEEGGFTLIEVNIAMIIITVVALAGLGALVGSLSAVATATERTRATQVANEVLEELETVPWNSLGFYAVDPRDTGSPPGYVSAFEGYPTVTLPAASVLDSRVPLPLRTVTRGKTTFTVRTHIVHLPEATDTRAFRRISALVSWTSADGRPRTARVDRNRTATTSERGFEAFLLRSLDAAVRETSGTEKVDPFLLTWSRTVAPSGSQVLVRATTNLSAAAVSLSYPAVDPVTNNPVQRSAAMSMVNGDDRSWQYAIPSTEEFRSETVTLTATATSAWDSTLKATLDATVDLLDAGHPTRRKVSVGSGYACRVDAGGAAWCWGQNGLGQLGNGTTTNSTTPVRVGASTPGFVGVRTVSTGTHHACATTKAGEVFCWGNAGAGRLGVPGPFGNCSGGTACQLTPAKVALSDVRLVSTGKEHTCASTGDLALHCWGNGTSGKLGTGSTSNEAAPKLIALADVVSVASGADHTCAVDAQTQVWCWGDGSSNRLNDLASRSTPGLTSVTGALTVSSPKSNGTGHTCVATTTGAVGCWGLNGSGQASGASSTSTTVRWVSGISNAVQVATGGTHSCTTTHDRATGVRAELCWGSNSKGAFGDGTTTSGGPSAVSSPAGMQPPLGNGGGGQTTCATSTDDAVWCRGEGAQGVLGNGTVSDSLVPVRVSGT